MLAASGAVTCQCICICSSTDNTKDRLRRASLTSLHTRCNPKTTSRCLVNCIHRLELCLSEPPSGTDRTCQESTNGLRVGEERNLSFVSLAKTDQKQLRYWVLIRAASIHDPLKSVLLTVLGTLRPSYRGFPVGIRVGFPMCRVGGRSIL
ncbi:hypothetical protein PSPO01_01110 [Paraphaeosphaeria sporulosa]